MVLNLSPKTKAGLAVALALLLWLPQGVSSDTVPVVTGHSTFYNGETYDKCLASIAGILRSRVLWFNDQVLYERYPGKGTFVFVTEKGAPDPSEQPFLISEGITYNFEDPNGAEWIIEEAYFEPEADPDVGGTKNPGASVTYDRYYVWFVELAATPVLDQWPGDEYPHSLYNFLVLVDTCKMERNALTNPQVVNHTTNLDDRHGHENTADPHDHEVFRVDLWVGKRPVVAPAAGVEEVRKQTTAWAEFNNGPG